MGIHPNKYISTTGKKRFGENQFWCFRDGQHDEIRVPTGKSVPFVRLNPSRESHSQRQSQESHFSANGPAENIVCSLQRRQQDGSSVWHNIDDVCQQRLQDDDLDRTQQQVTCMVPMSSRQESHLEMRCRNSNIQTRSQGTEQPGSATDSENVMGITHGELRASLDPERETSLGLPDPEEHGLCSGVENDNWQFQTMCEERLKNKTSDKTDGRRLEIDNVCGCSEDVHEHSHAMGNDNDNDGSIDNEVEDGDEAEDIEVETADISEQTQPEDIGEESKSEPGDEVEGGMNDQVTDSVSDVFDEGVDIDKKTDRETSVRDSSQENGIDRNSIEGNVPKFTKINISMSMTQGNTLENGSDDCKSIMKPEVRSDDLRAELDAAIKSTKVDGLKWSRGCLKDGEKEDGSELEHARGFLCRQSQNEIPLLTRYLKLGKMRDQQLDKIYRQLLSPAHLEVDRTMRTITAFPLTRQQHPEVRQHPSEVQGIPWNNFERHSMREASFFFYPESAPKSKDLLAAAGFVYIGDGDNDKVICYFCFMEKENWRADEDIGEVHRSLSPHCPMVVVVSSNNISATTVTVVSESDRMGAAAPSGAAGDAGAGPALTYISSRPPAPPPGLDRVDHPGKGQENQGQGQQNRFRPRPSPISPSAIYESQHPLARGPLNNQSQPTTTTTRTTPNTGASSSTTQNSQANEDAHQHGNHPVINSQIYAIPANPPTPASSSQEAGGDSTTSNSDTTSGRDAADSAGQVTVPRQLNYRDLGIFHERPKHPQFAVLVVRLQSYADWPRDHPLKPDDLAKSGLYFAGYADCCKCFFCGGGLRRWDPEDDAFVEHARWFPKCGYIRQYMGEQFVEAVTELKPRGGTITFQQVRNYMAQKNMSVSNEFEDMPIAEDAAVKSLLDEGYNKERVCSVAKELRDSGVPLSADIILEKLNNLNVTDASASVGAMAQAAREAGRRKDDKGIQQLKDQNYTLRSNLTCKICMDKEVKVVFLPCGHLVACQECAVALQDCPVCRRHIRATVRASIR